MTGGMVSIRCRLPVQIVAVQHCRWTHEKARAPILLCSNIILVDVLVTPPVDGHLLGFVGAMVIPCPGNVDKSSP
jgi:hypothetical protein